VWVHHSLVQPKEHLWTDWPQHLPLFGAEQVLFGPLPLPLLLPLLMSQLMLLLLLLSHEQMSQRQCQPVSWGDFEVLLLLLVVRLLL
jgi:hypothetical protein